MVCRGENFAPRRPAQGMSPWRHSMRGYGRVAERYPWFATEEPHLDPDAAGTGFNDYTVPSGQLCAPQQPLRTSAALVGLFYPMPGNPRPWRAAGRTMTGPVTPIGMTSGMDACRRAGRTSRKSTLRPTLRDTLDNKHGLL